MRYSLAVIFSISSICWRTAFFLEAKLVFVSPCRWGVRCRSLLVDRLTRRRHLETAVVCECALIIGEPHEKIVVLRCRHFASSGPFWTRKKHQREPIVPIAAGGSSTHLQNRTFSTKAYTYILCLVLWSCMISIISACLILMSLSCVGRCSFNWLTNFLHSQTTIAKHQLPYLIPPITISKLHTLLTKTLAAIY